MVYFSAYKCPIIDGVRVQIAYSTYLLELSNVTSRYELITEPCMSDLSTASYSLVHSGTPQLCTLLDLKLVDYQTSNIRE